MVSEPLSRSLPLLHATIGPLGIEVPEGWMPALQHLPTLTVACDLTATWGPTGPGHKRELIATFPPTEAPPAPIDGVTIDSHEYALEIRQVVTSRISSTAALDAFVAAFPGPGLVIADTVKRLDGPASIVTIDVGYHGARMITADVRGTVTDEVKTWLEGEGGFQYSVGRWRQDVAGWAVGVLHDGLAPGAKMTIVASRDEAVAIGDDHPCVR